MSKLNLKTHILRIRFVDKSKNNSNFEVDIYFPKELKNYSSEFKDHIHEFNSAGYESIQGTVVELPYEYMKNIVNKILCTAQCEILKVKKEMQDKEKIKGGGGKGDPNLTTHTVSVSK
jgi:hypothetical protein